MERSLSLANLIAVKILTRLFKIRADPNSSLSIRNESIVSYKRTEVT